MVYQSAEMIERQLERDRSELAFSIARLKYELSLAALMDQGKVALAGQVGPVLCQVDRALRAQPLAAGLAGVALATLVFGRNRAKAPATPAPALAGTRYEALTRWEDEGGPVQPEIDPEEEWLVAAQGLRARAGEMLRRIDDAARRRLAPAAELARHRADVVSALARDTRTAMEKGLEGLSASARDKVIAARERAYVARLSLAGGINDGVKKHPVALATALAALGGALAFAFPMTQTENDLIGETRDELVAQTKRALRDEMLKASDLAQTLSAVLGRDIRTVGRAFGAPEGLHRYS